MSNKRIREKIHRRLMAKRNSFGINWGHDDDTVLVNWCNGVIVSVTSYKSDKGHYQGRKLSIDKVRGGRRKRRAPVRFIREQ